MPSTAFHHAALAAAISASLACPPALADRTELSFDTPARGFAEVLAVYGLQTDGRVLDAQVSDGALRLYGTGSVNGNLLFSAAAGDYAFSVLAGIGSNAPGNVNVGFSTGNLHLHIHPGFWDQYFVPGLGLQGSLGFTPDATLPTRFDVDISAAGLVTAVVRNGQQQALLHFTDSAYQPGLSRPGLTIGSVPGGFAVYDNLVITTVPEPAHWALLLPGLLLGAAWLRRQRPAGDAPQP